MAGRITGMKLPVYILLRKARGLMETPRFFANALKDISQNHYGEALETENKWT